MYDYTKEENYKIENVDHEIHILGVKAPALPWCAYIFIGFLTINPIVSFVVTFIFIRFARMFFDSDRAGTPIEYSNWFLRMVWIWPISEIFSNLKSIKSSEEEYRD
jgi:hypothetical protein